MLFILVVECPNGLKDLHKALDDIKVNELTYRNAAEDIKYLRLLVRVATLGEYVARKVKVGCKQTRSIICSDNFTETINYHVNYALEMAMIGYSQTKQIFLTTSNNNRWQTVKTITIQWNTSKLTPLCKLTSQNGYAYHLQLFKSTSYTIPIVIVIFNTAAWPRVRLIGSGPLKYTAYNIELQKINVL